MTTVAFDFETRYDDEISVTKLGPRCYFSQLALEDIYLVSIKGSDGYEYVGHPAKADWKRAFTGNVALAHNAQFETEGILRLRQLGVQIPDPAELHDTADLAAYCGFPRNLKGAAFSLFKVVHDKNIRDRDMKGKGWADMSPELREAVSKYALEDSGLTLKIWETLSDKWPENERIASRLSREWAIEGIQVDEKAMDAAIAKLKHTIWGAGRLLPWVIEDGAPPLSPKALGAACRKEGILPPTSLAMDNEECDAWMETYGEKYPWVKAMRDWRRANALLKKLESMKARTFGGRLRYEIKYWGAGVTGRWSGGGGVNVQNFSGKDLYGVNMRDMLIAAPGHVLIAADLAQIEPRVAAYLAGESEALQAMFRGVSPYIVYARQAMGLGENEEWPKSDPRYKIAKISVLGASYCAGHHRFADLMRAVGMEDVLDSALQDPESKNRYVSYINEIGLPQWLKVWREADDVLKHRLVKSWEIVQTFRNGRPKLIDLWKRLGDLAKRSAINGEDIILTLPSGRNLVYKNSRYRRKSMEEGGGSEVVGEIVRHGSAQTSRIHQGILIENLCQATARDVFRDCLLAVTQAGLKVVFHVHDELVVEVPENEAEAAKEKILALMGKSPSWAPNLPVAAEAHIATQYSKMK